MDALIKDHNANSNGFYKMIHNSFSDLVLLYSIHLKISLNAILNATYQHPKEKEARLAVLPPNYVRTVDEIVEMPLDRAVPASVF